MITRPHDTASAMDAGPAWSTPTRHRVRSETQGYPSSAGRSTLQRSNEKRHPWEVNRRKPSHSRLEVSHRRHGPNSTVQTARSKQHGPNSTVQNEPRPRPRTNPAPSDGHPMGYPIHILQCAIIDVGLHAKIQVRWNFLTLVSNGPSCAIPMSTIIIRMEHPSDFMPKVFPFNPDPRNVRPGEA